MFQKKLYRKSKHTFYFQFFFLSRAVCEIIWGNTLEHGRPQIKYSTCALRARNSKLQKHTPTICNNYCFSTATMVAQMLLNIALNVQYINCLVIVFMSFKLLA